MSLSSSLQVLWGNAECEEFRDKKAPLLFLHRFAPEKLIVQGGVPGFWWESRGSLGLRRKEQMFLSVWAEHRGQSRVFGSCCPKEKVCPDSYSAQLAGLHIFHEVAAQSQHYSLECLISALVHAKECCNCRPELFFFFFFSVLFFFSFFLGVC